MIEPAKRVKLTIRRGRSYAFQSLWREATKQVVDGVETIIPGPVYGLAGWTGRMQVRSGPGALLVAEFTSHPFPADPAGVAYGVLACRNPDDVVDPDVLTDWNFRLDMTPEQTALIPAGSYLFDVELIDTIGTEVPFMEGRVTVKEVITV